MSELAFNQNGESFEIPATVTGWRVRRMKPRGAPELVYGKDGRPLVVGIDADIDELRDAVGTTGKYRLDPINDDGKTVENVPAAYVQVMKPLRNAETTLAVAPATSGSANDDTVREAMRMNSELAKSVIEKFPEMMTAAAELLRAADGAGLPARSPRMVEHEDAEGTPPAPSSNMLHTMLAQAIPLLLSGLAGKGMPKLAEIVDWRKATPAARAATAVETPTSATPMQAASASAERPALGPAAMAHFLAIQAALTPQEAALARSVAADLSGSEQAAWLDELTKLSVEDAVGKIRALIASTAGVS